MIPVCVTCRLCVGCVLRVYSYNKSCQRPYGKAQLKLELDQIVGLCSEVQV